jgi:GT2 family glycosyltransferase
MADAGYPFVSIVILNYNGKQFLDRCLTSIFNQSFSNFEVVFVDNASFDGSVDYVKTRFGHDTRLKIVENKGNSGPIEGNNVGIRLVNRRTSYIVLLNNDTELTVNWLYCMINAMESDPKIGATCSKQLLMDDRERLQGVGSFIDPCGFNYLLGEYEIDTGQYNGDTLEIFAAGTTALFIRTDLLRQIGLLDSNYDFGFDDVDLCWRIWLRGYKVVCVSRCTMYHKVSGTNRKLVHVLFHREKNRIMTVIKNYSVPYQFRFLPLILSFDLSQLLWFAFTNNFSMFWAIGRALMWNMKHFRYMWAQHLKIKYYIRKVSDKEIISHMVKINPIELWRRIGSQHLNK